MPASISTRLDEQEFLELADSYYIHPRREMIDYPSRTGSTTTISTNTHLRRRDTTHGPRRWRPSTLQECDDSGSARGSEIDESHQYDIVEGQTRTLSHLVISPLKTQSSISLESYSDDSQTFRTVKRDINTLPQLDPVIRSPSSLPTKTSRPISTASLASGSCFGIMCVPRWMKGSSKPGIRKKKQKRLQATQSVNRAGEASGPDNGFSTIPLDSSRPGGEYFMSLPYRGFASASSPLLGLDYDYHLAVEVLINGSDVAK